MDKNQENIELDLKHIFLTLRFRIWVVILAGIVCAAAAFFYAYFFCCADVYLQRYHLCQ